MQSARPGATHKGDLAVDQDPPQGKPRSSKMTSMKKDMAGLWIRVED